jgi:hypothetical protein
MHHLMHSAATTREQKRAASTLLCNWQQGPCLDDEVVGLGKGQNVEEEEAKVMQQ